MPCKKTGPSAGERRGPLPGNPAILHTRRSITGVVSPAIELVCRRVFAAKRDGHGQFQVPGEEVVQQEYAVGNIEIAIIVGIP